MPQAGWRATRDMRDSPATLLAARLKCSQSQSHCSGDTSSTTCTVATNNVIPNRLLLMVLATASAALASWAPQADAGEIPSTRHIYSRPQARDTTATSSTSSRASLVQKQMSSLRVQLDWELRQANLSGLRQMELSAPCTRSSDCRPANSHCQMDSLTCACQPQHVQLDSTQCLPTTLLGFHCQIDAQCQHRVPSSQCDQLTRTCVCQPNLVPYRRDKCLAPSRLGEYCLADKQCQLADRHARCDWRIVNIYGTCRCPPNYKLLQADDESQVSNRTAKQQLVCVPRLGDTCLSDRECERATPHSSCQESSSLVPSGRWPSSRASSRRCHCSAGFAPAQNQLDCIRLWPEQQQQLQQSKQHEVSLGSEHKYELLGGGAANDAQQTGSGATPTTPTPTPTTTSSTTSTSTTTERLALALAIAPKPAPPKTVPDTAASNATRVSSLGKTCVSSAECRARDPNSACLAGVCECLRPTGECSARSAGCPRDTFQCRSGQCISWYFVCDQMANCDDGSDEADCWPGKCPAEAFQCHSDGRCVTRAKVCNGKRDCADASDERQCWSSSSLGLHRQQNLLPVPGNDTATAAEVATNSTSTTRSCHPDAFACRDGTCLPSYVFCNAVNDCADASDEDERVCERRAPTRSTSAPLKQQQQESPLVKTDRLAIERLLATLALSPSRTPERRGHRARARTAKLMAEQQISNNLRDQKQQQTTELAGLEQCPRWAFTCRNGKCRSSAILCSGVDGCGDNSDEAHCEVCKCAPPVEN